MTQPRRSQPFPEIDPAIPREFVTITAEDGIPSWGLLYSPPAGEAWAAVHLIHPRTDFSRHYLASTLPRAGIAVLGQNSRYLNNDRDCVHERVLLDVAAGQRFLAARGFERRAFVGNSGGASLLAFYQAQAATRPPNRIAGVPGDSGIDLNAFDLPQAHAYVSVAGHPGQGVFMESVIDPSVVDEANPLLTNAALDMYNPANGYRPLPEASSYSKPFLAHYREAQRRRVARLDAVSRGHLATQDRAAAEAAAPNFGTRSPAEQVEVRKAAVLDRIMVVYRTLADPAYLDPTIDPNERPLGSIFAADPLVGNYWALSGMGRTVTPRAWLSTWSSLSSNANLVANLPGVALPTLIVSATGDEALLPSAVDRVLSASGAADRELASIRATHYLEPLPGTNSQPREELASILVDWLRTRLQ